MKHTKHTSFIPMTPDVRPKQRLNEVVGLPDKPDDLNILIEWKDPITSKHYPKGTPRKRIFVCSVEWAWSPMNNRIANYYINPKPWGWAFWDNWLDDHDVPWSWWWNFIRDVASRNTCAAKMPWLSLTILVRPSLSAFISAVSFPAFVLAVSSVGFVCLGLES